MHQIDWGEVIRKWHIAFPAPTAKSEAAERPSGAGSPQNSEGVK